MKGDFTRSTFAPANHYTGVRLQQGRVQLDADWNEHVDLTAHRFQTEAVDVIGNAGAPLHAAAFQTLANASSLDATTVARLTAIGVLPLDANDLLFTPGRFYVEGALCEVDDYFTLTRQPDFPEAEPLPGPGTYLVYLDAWERHLTAVEVPPLKEVALGGPDTATRTRQIWQVRWLADPNAFCVRDPQAWRTLLPVSSGRLTARAETAAPSTDPCILPPGSGYRRLENQLYRVEIHRPGNPGTATFKWSRDNGTVLTRITEVVGPQAWRVEDLGRDSALGFLPGQVVEYVDETIDLHESPGELLTIASVDPASHLITFAAAPATAPDLNRGARLRRWDGAAPGEALLQTGVPIPIEDGIEVLFDNGRYNTGDYWLIPARVATGDVEWPRDAAGNPLPQPPAGVRHRYASLAVVTVARAGVVDLHDCRRLFPPLTELTDPLDWLKRHNRLLHGWGVVCGLQVHCAGARRETVRVESGYALECDGSELRVPEPRLVPIVDLANQAGLLEGERAAQVCLTVRNGAASQLEFGVRRPPARKSVLQEILHGTLLQEILDDCVQPLLRELRELLFAKPTGENALVPVSRRRLLAAINLLVQLGGDPATRRIHLSPREHELLRDLHQRLLDLVQSQVFCGLRDGIREFPDYPFADPTAETLFGLHLMSRIRVTPDGRTAWAFGAEAPGQLSVFDVVSGELVRHVQLPAVAGVTLGPRDVAFQRDGTAIVAAGDTASTVVFLFRPGATSPESQVNLPGVRVARLATVDSLAGFGVLALVVGQGVAWLNPVNAGPELAFVARFNATGQWAQGEGLLERVFWAGASTNTAGQTTEVYDAIVEITLRERDATTRTVPLGATGRDDLAVLAASAAATSGVFARLHVVLDPLVNTTQRRLRVFDTASGRVFAEHVLPTDGPVQLAASAAFGTVYASLPEEHLVLRFPSGAPTLDRSLDLPAQIAPSGVALGTLGAVGARGEAVLLIANRTSQTLTRVEPRIARPEGRYAFERLADYRAAVLAAYVDLGLRLLQRLKDCACEKLLRPCPTCDPEDDVLVLACVEIRGGQVFRICNHDRREVVTFPKLFHWLSAIPVIPALTWLVERLCCTPLVGGREPGTTLAPGLLGARQLARLDLTQAQQRLSATGATLQLQGNALGKLALAAGVDRLFRGPQTPAATAVLQQTTPAAVETLRASGVDVVGVEEYSEALATHGLGALTRLRLSAQPGERVRLLLKDGKVAALLAEAPAAVTSSTPAGATTSGTATGVIATGATAELQELRAQIADLRRLHAETVAERDRTLAELRTEVRNLVQRPDQPINPAVPVSPVTPVAPVSPVMPISPVTPVSPVNPGLNPAIPIVRKAPRKRGRKGGGTTSPSP